MELLLEVLPTQEVKEKTLQRNYYNVNERNALEHSGYVPVNPYAESGIAIKTVRELVV